MYNDNQNNPQEFRPTGRGRRGGMHGGRFAADDMRQDGQGMAQCRRHGGNGGRGRDGQGYGQGMGMRQNGQDVGMPQDAQNMDMPQCRRHGGNGGRGRNGQGYGQAMGQCRRRSGMSQSRSTLPGSAPANPAGDGTDD